MAEPELKSEALALSIAALAADKKAIDIVVLDLRELHAYTDFFIVCSGGSDRQVKAIHDGIHLGMKNDHGMLPVRVEGMPQARWVVMDYVDSVVHAFVPEVRDFYRLEQLWGEVPRLALPEPVAS
jgi:ribosome-associated protein